MVPLVSFCAPSQRTQLMRTAAFSGSVDLAAATLARFPKVLHCRFGHRSLTPLHVACARGHTRLVAFLLDRGANPAALSATRRSPVEYALANQHLSVALAMHDRGIVSSEDLFGLAVTHGMDRAVVDLLRYFPVPAATVLLAVRMGLCGSATIGALCAAGGSPNEASDSGLRPLHYAALRADGAELVPTLVCHGADVSLADQCSTTLPLTYAAVFRSDVDLLRVCVELGASLHVKRMSALHMAVAKADPNTAIVLELLRLGADPVAWLDDHGRSAVEIGAVNPNLDAAAWEGLLFAALSRMPDSGRGKLLALAVRSNSRTKITSLLPHLSHKMVNDAALQECPVLHMAVRWGDAEVIQVLLAAGADPNRRWKDETVFQSELSRNRREDVVRCLLRYGADPNSHVPGTSAPPAVLALPDTRLLNTMRLHGANLGAGDCRGVTPLMHLSYCENELDAVRCAAYLLGTAGADLNARDDAGRTALWHAVSADSIELARLLLSRPRGAEHAPDHAGTTPLHEACRRRPPNAHMIRLLVASGAEIAAGRPLEALRGNSLDVQRLLMEVVLYGAGAEEAAEAIAAEEAGPAAIPTPSVSDAKGFDLLGGCDDETSSVFSVATVE
jgi:ankyrin repeat protein